MKSASSSTANISEMVKDVKGVKVLAHRVDNLERAQLRTLVDQLRDKIGSGVVILGSASNGNVALIVGVTKDLTGRVQAGKVIGAGGAKGWRQGRRASGPGRGWGERCVRAGCRAGRGLWRGGGDAGMSSTNLRRECLRWMGGCTSSNTRATPSMCVDFSHCTAKEILVLLDLVRADVSRHPPGSLLSLTDFTGAQIDKEVATQGEEDSGARSSLI